MIGIVFGVVLDYAFKVAFVESNGNPEIYWRFVFAFTGIAVIIQLISILTNFIPESPMSLIERGRMDEAKAVLAKFNIP
jgi:TctA family transporter